MLRYLPLAALLLLAGCYSAEEPLLTDDKAVTPYSVIEYTDKDDGLHVRHTLTRDGTSYIETADDGSVTQRLRLMAVEQDWFIIEMTSGDDDSPMPNYGYLHLDAAKGEAEVYATNTDEATSFDGSYACGSDVCFDDLDEYRRHAEGLISDGAGPDSSYYVTLTE